MTETTTAIRWCACRDLGPERGFYKRVFDTKAEAEAELAVWQNPRPNGMIDGGDWSVRPARYEVRPDGAQFFTAWVET
jgi:hypothetical protein